MTAIETSGTIFIASARPSRSARIPVTSGPAARPSRLLASVSTPKAVARSRSGVRLETMTPAGPAVPAQKNPPSASSSS